MPSGVSTPSKWLSLEDSAAQATLSGIISTTRWPSPPFSIISRRPRPQEEIAFRNVSSGTSSNVTLSGLKNVNSPRHWRRRARHEDEKPPVRELVHDQRRTLALLDQRPAPDARTFHRVPRAVPRRRRPSPSGSRAFSNKCCSSVFRVLRPAAERIRKPITRHSSKSSTTAVISG